MILQVEGRTLVSMQSNDSNSANDDENIGIEMRSQPEKDNEKENILLENVNINVIMNMIMALLLE
jgi:hypothetical protein